MLIDGRPSAVLFDVGSTLIHIDPAVLTACLTRHGVSGVAEHDASAAFLLSLEASRERLPLGQDDLGKEAMRWAQLLDVPSTPACAAFKEAVQRPDLYSRLAPDAKPVLAALRASGVTLVAVANDDGGLAAQLARTGLAEFFGAAMDSTVFGVEKPDGEIFRAACHTAGVLPSEACFVGDGLINDLLGAWAAGIGRCLLYDPHRLRPEIPETLRINSLTDILGIVSAASDERPRGEIR
ncbi:MULTISPECIES: HAD family hydrolase [Nocardiopsidaceae]|uniref:HAD family hydrolase n=1 Tax=Streptomonospora nanhaiensis TaxID=1323731 RepID=A0ABY6YP69_9ACTN|nr:HAD family hydrolase [Streptomonospora nanhaiensis]WAE74055.1 HAD family hydrolase [Streptomonospora nanhaiensis]